MWGVKPLSECKSVGLPGCLNQTGKNRGIISITEMNVVGE